MPYINVLFWNIENYGTSKHKASNGGKELYAFIVEVLKRNEVHIAGFAEIRSNLGAQIGADLKQKLNTAISGSSWEYKDSAQFVPKRLEQYLFLYDERKVKAYGATKFQHVFKDPADQSVLGFPRKTKDRPPYLGYFETQDAKKKKIVVGIMHSPNPSDKKGVKEAPQKIALIDELKSGDVCVVMGDFNVKAVSDHRSPNSVGEAAFLNLVNKGFEQRLLDDVQSSLINKKMAFAGMEYDDCRSQPYDQIFLYAPTTGRFTVGDDDDGIDALIDNCSTIAPAGSTTSANSDTYLMEPLRAIQNINYGESETEYDNVEDAFVAFRGYVSDHYPVFIKLTYP